MYLLLQSLRAMVMAVWLAVPPGAGVAVPAGIRPPASYRITGVPLAESRPNWCGPAALAAVLQYHGEEVSAADIAGDIYLPGYRGALNLDLYLWAKARKFDAHAGAGAPGDIKQALARDRPVICMVRRRGPLAHRSHFVVLSGYDDDRGIWLIDDGSGDLREVRDTDFGRSWTQSGRWMLVIEGRRAGSPSEERGEGD